MGPRRLSHARVVAFTVAYLGLLALATAVADWYATPDGVSVWFPPAALTFAFLLLVDLRVAVPVAIAGRVLFSVFFGIGSRPLWVSVIIALGVTLAYAAGARVLRALASGRLREGEVTTADVTWFTAVAGIASGLAAASSRALLALTGEIPWSETADGLVDFWIGDAVAVLTLVPLGWAAWRLVRGADRTQLSEVLALGIASAAIAPVALEVTIGNQHPLYLIVVPLLVSALRHGAVGAALSGGLVALSLATRMHVTSVAVAVSSVHLFLASTVGFALLMGAVAASRQRLIAQLRRTNADRQAATAALERQREALNTFSRRVAHDLRGPLSTMQGLAELVADPDVDEETRADLADRVARNAASALNLVRELLDDARTSSAAGSAVQTDMRAVVESVEELFAPMLMERDAKLSAEVHVDAVPLPAIPLKQILVNLVGNAVKHAAANGHTSIVVRATADERTFRLLVADDGPGIPADVRPTLFPPSRRRRDASTSNEGLGLVVCHDLTRDLGGRIRVEPNEPSGARFVVEVPITARRAG